jgi:hypothetical protein
MYGKIFDSIYDSTVADDWRALITFQQFIVLCDADGTVDMTPQAISRRTNIPIEHIKAGIEILEAPDLYSRTEGQDGIRIERLDSHRPWGWSIVNHKQYRNLASRAEKLEADRIRIAEKRAKANGNADVAECRKVSQGVADVAHTDTDADTDAVKELGATHLGKKATPSSPVPVQEIVNNWNDFAEINRLPKVVKITNTLRGQIRQRWTDIPSMAQWDNFFHAISSSTFLSGKAPPGNGRTQPFRSTLLWITKETNFAKIAAGEYS